MPRKDIEDFFGYLENEGFDLCISGTGVIKKQRNYDYNYLSSLEGVENIKCVINCIPSIPSFLKEEEGCVIDFSLTLPPSELGNKSLREVFKNNLISVKRVSLRLVDSPEKERNEKR